MRRPHEETSAFSGTTCIIIAESAKQIHSTVCLSVRACLEKGQVVADSDRDLGHAPALPGMPSYSSGGFRGGRGRGANEPPFEADNSDFVF